MEEGSCVFCDPDRGMFIESGECKNCTLANCKRCSDSSTCTECDEEKGYYLKEGESECSLCDSANNMFLSGGECLPCRLTGCSKCSSLAVCSEYGNGYLLKDNICSPCNADEDEFVDNGECKQCRLDGCTDCSSLSVCVECD